MRINPRLVLGPWQRFPGLPAAGVLAVAVCAVLLTGSAAPPADDAPDLDKLQGMVEGIRKLEFTASVPAEKQNVEDFEAFLDAELDKVFPEGQARDLMDGLLRLGLLKEEIDIGGSLKQAMLTQAGAYYDPATKKFFYLMVDLPKSEMEMVAAHELVHALQDQHFDLSGLMHKMEHEWWDNVRHDDRILAARSLVEGEATYVQLLLQFKEMSGMDVAADPKSEEMMFKMMGNMSLSTIVAQAKLLKGFMGEENDITKALDAMEDIPPYIMEPLYAAYMSGAYFTMRLRHHGGWDEVAQAYKNYPLSSEQTLHPEKFLDERDDPTPIKMDALNALTGEGWTKIDAAIHGEFYLGILLRMHGMSEAASRRSARGWDGDLYQAYRHTDGRVMVTMATTWDDAKSAERFAKAYLSILPAKLDIEMLNIMHKADSGVDVMYGCGEAGGVGRVTWRGREAFVVEGADRDTVDAAMDEMLGLKIEHVE